MGVPSFAMGIEPARRYRLLPYFFALQLHRCHLTRRLVEKWWSKADAEPLVAAWLDVLAALPPAHRQLLARWLHRSGEIRKAVPEGLSKVLCTGAALHPPKFVAYHTEDLVSQLRKGSSVAFIEAWLEMRCDPRTCASLRSDAPEAEFPLARARYLLTGGFELDQAFRACAAGDAGLRLIMRRELENLTLDERAAVIDFALLAPEAAHVLLTEMAATSPERRASFAAHFYPEAKYELSGIGSGDLSAILRRWNGDTSPLLELVKWVRLFPCRLRATVIALSDDLARQLAKAGRGLSAEARLDGGRSVIAANADLALEWLATAPAHFIETCNWAAGYGAVRTRRLLRHAASLPLFQPLPVRDGSADWLVQLDRLLHSHLELAKRLLEFVTWDKHFAGAKVLKPASIEDVAHRIAARIPTLQMWWVQAEVRRELAVHPEEHASLFRAMVLENRRPLTRFLREHRAQRDSRLDHPANRHWLTRHGASFNMEAWLAPPEMDEGEIILAVERDPLEILKIGSYVGSCLAMGGFNAHATVAILLDVNKRVVFARNARGRFVARQVVAISDDHKLICYDVYGNRKSSSLEEAFERYATAWSSKLGLPLARGAEHVSTERVRPLTVKSWYDDGLWERFSA